MITKPSRGLKEAPGLSLPCQILPPKDPTGPQRLWAAVLDNAVMGLEKRGAFNSWKSKHRLRDEALVWLQTNLTEPGSFIFICEHLGLDSDFLRERLLTKYYGESTPRRTDAPLQLKEKLI